MAADAGDGDTVEGESAIAETCEMDAVLQGSPEGSECGHGDTAEGRQLREGMPDVRSTASDVIALSVPTECHVGRNCSQTA